MNKPHNIYIHVPFCMSKCKYCAFFSRACKNPDWNYYAQQICSEIKYWGNHLNKTSVPTIFFGGGTPSLMPINVFEQIMSAIHNNFSLNTDTEVTLEANPGTLDEQKLDAFIASGINRLSIGVQRLDDESLQFLGRQHSIDTALKLLDNALTKNIRVSADFIYGIPDDNVNIVKNMCQKINNIGITHCSMYELTIEESTPFGKMQLNMPSNDEMADMYNTINDTLNMPRYEVSNYSVIGHECRHNQNVWNGEPYIGIGNGAAGRIYVDNQWYEQRGNNEQFDKMSSKERAIEILITGLRTTCGIKLTDEIKNIIDTEYINKHSDLIKLSDDRIAATKSGMLILDELLLNMVK